MHIKFIKYFVDPITKEPLDIDITERHGDIVERGFFRSKNAEYPISKGIPRFVPVGTKNYAESFKYQWQKWSRTQFESDNVGKPMAGLTLDMWERITGIKDGLSGQVILDIGCGSGRFLEILRQKGAECIGLDYSAEVVESAAENFAGDPGVCVCQASALNLPINPGALDGTFSIGVLHHTPDPFQGVKEAAKVIKPGGWLALAVYGKGHGYDAVVLNLWRRFFGFLWPVFRHYPPLSYTYATVYFNHLINKIPYAGRIINGFFRILFPNVNLPDINWAILDTFDSITPSHQSTHESYEVYQWLKSCGLTDIEPTNWGFTSYRGIKPAE